MRVIWATRGLVWGFQFLRTGGFSDPLPVYERAFSGIEDELPVFRRSPEGVAFRFPDPLGRSDRSGRVIPHEFVVLGPSSAELSSVEDGLRLVWPEVADEYARVWDQPKAPPMGA